MSRYRHLAEWAETLLCNAQPQAHCSQAEWDDIVKRWRDELHGLSTPEQAQDDPLEDIDEDLTRENPPQANQTWGDEPTHLP